MAQDEKPNSLRRISGLGVLPRVHHLRPESGRRLVPRKCLAGAGKPELEPGQKRLEDLCVDGPLLEDPLQLVPQGPVSLRRGREVSHQQLVDHTLDRLASFLKLILNKSLP